MNIEHLIDEEIADINYKMTETTAKFLHRSLAKMFKAITQKDFEKAQSIKEYMIQTLDVFEKTVKGVHTSDQ